MAIRQWHPGQLVVLWVGGALMMLFLHAALPEVPLDRWVAVEETNPYIIALERENPGTTRRRGYTEPIWWGRALLWTGGVVYFLIPVVLLGVTWRWFGGRART